MALRSIHDANYDEPTVFERQEEQVQGQPQTARELDDGKVTVRETRFAADTVIVDPNHELAVQVLPEGSTVGIEPAAASSWAEGTAEQKLAKLADESDDSDSSGGDADPKEVSETVPAPKSVRKQKGTDAPSE